MRNKTIKTFIKASFTHNESQLLENKSLFLNNFIHKHNYSIFEND